MRQIKNQNLAQLLAQLRFASEQQRLTQLDAAEKLLTIIDTDTEYPFDFVCFRITGFQPKDLPQQQPIKGDHLTDDLCIFISMLSTGLFSPSPSKTKKFTTLKSSQPPLVSLQKRFIVGED